MWWLFSGIWDLFTSTQYLGLQADKIKLLLRFLEWFRLTVFTAEFLNDARQAFERLKERKAEVKEKIEEGERMSDQAKEWLEKVEDLPNKYPETLSDSMPDFNEGRYKLSEKALEVKRHITELLTDVESKKLLKTLPEPEPEPWRIDKVKFLVAFIGVSSMVMVHVYAGRRRRAKKMKTWREAGAM